MYSNWYMYMYMYIGMYVHVVGLKRTDLFGIV